jgi:hypothetical protein
MPRLPDPSTIRLRPASVALGELAIAAGLVGESVTIAGNFRTNTVCQMWKYYTQTLGGGNVIHVRARRDLKDFEARLADIRAVFVNSPRLYQDVAWTIQMAGSGTMSARPAVFCGFQHEDPDADPGLCSDPGAWAAEYLLGLDPAVDLGRAGLCTAALPRLFCHTAGGILRRGAHRWGQ